MLVLALWLVTAYKRPGELETSREYVATTAEDRQRRRLYGRLLDGKFHPHLSNVYVFMYEKNDDDDDVRW